MKLRSNRETTFKEITTKKPIRKRILKTKIKIVKVKRMSNPVLIGPQNNPEELDDSTAEQPSKPRKMSDHLTKVSQLKIVEGNLSENWRRFKRNFDIFMTAGELTEKSDAIKVNTFLNAVGEEAVEIFDSFNLSTLQRAHYDTVIQAFSDFCTPKKNTVYERYMFYQRKQKEGETFDSFLIDIRRLVRTCDFKEKESEMLRDQIVMAVNNQGLQRKLLETANLTYDTAVDKCRTFEATNEQTSEMSKTVAVNQIKETNHVTGKKHKQHRKYNANSKGNESNVATGKAHTQHRKSDTSKRESGSERASSNNNDKTIVNCRYCGQSHKVRQCPAYGKNCTTCAKRNHFSSVCKSKNISAISAHESNYDSSDNDTYYVSSIERVCAFGESDDDRVSYPWIEKIWIGRKSVAFKIDTGAEVNVIPLSIFRQLSEGIELHRTGVKLRAFSGETLRPVGMCSLFGEFENMSCNMRTAVVDIDVMPILGLKSCIELGLVSPSTRSQVIKSRTFTNSAHKQKL